MKKTIISVTQETPPERLDMYISLNSSLTRSHIQKLIKQGLVSVNLKKEKAGYRVREGDQIELIVPDEPEGMLIPEDIPLDVLWEDEHIIVINKPPHMVIYPATGNRSGTLMNALVSHCDRLSSVGAPLRPGIVHRLDKDTSGTIVVAKSDEAYHNLVRQFKNREVEKHYVVLLFGALKSDRGELRIPIGRSVSNRKKMSTKTKQGKEAITQFEVVKRLQSATLVNVRILTGRTHQIRVHFASSGNPVLGDKTYGKKTKIVVGYRTITFPRQMLHASSLKLLHPVTRVAVNIAAPLPEDMKKAIGELVQASLI